MPYRPANKGKINNSIQSICKAKLSINTGIKEAIERLKTEVKGTGRAVIFTTLALVGGFLSMLSNQLLAIRDMGLVAAVTITGAMFADLLFLPALYVGLASRKSES